jgi:chromosomal replication initiation ATPase DnaA
MEATFNIYKAAVQYQQPKVTNDNLIIIKIKEVIKEVTGVNWERINQPTRQREIMLSRQIFHFLCRKFTSQSLKFIGALTTRNYDHSSVINSIEQITYIVDLKHRSDNWTKVESAILRMTAYTGKVIL